MKLESLSHQVQEESREAVGVMREEVTMVEEGVRLARDAEQALQKDPRSSGSFTRYEPGYNKAAAEQARGIRQVTRL